MGKVVGNLVSTVKVPCHNGCKLMAVREVDLCGREFGPVHVAVDSACAGPGDLVLFSREGGSCRMIMGDQVMADAAIAGVLDRLPVQNSLHGSGPD